MGTTTKGLRYPEANVLGNTLHTRVRELAEDMNTQLSSRDTRFDGLDTKTNNTNTVLNARGLPIARYSGYGATGTNLPNSGVAYTTHYMANLAIVPAGSRVAVVSMHMPAHNVANAQSWWNPLASFGGSGWMSMFASGYIAVHNQSNPAMNMGFSVTSAFDVRSYIGTYFGVAMDAHNDPGSGAWTHVGYLNWSVTFES